MDNRKYLLIKSRKKVEDNDIVGVYDNLEEAQYNYEIINANYEKFGYRVWVKGILSNKQFKNELEDKQKIKITYEIEGVINSNITGNKLKFLKDYIVVSTITENILFESEPKIKIDYTLIKNES